MVRKDNYESQRRIKVRREHIVEISVLKSPLEVFDFLVRCTTCNWEARVYEKDDAELLAERHRVRYNTGLKIKEKAKGEA